MTKGGFTFAAAHVISRLMKDFEKGSLMQFTPCRFKSLNETIHALAVVHTEIVLIHPFRDGNGRLARLLAVLMGLPGTIASIGLWRIGWKKASTISYRYQGRFR